MRKKYRSKIGFIAFAPFLLTFCAFGTVGFILGALDRWIFYINFIIPLIPTLLLIPLRYIIDNKELIVKSSFYKIKIDIDTILKIKEKNSVFLVNTFAFSLDRLEITYNKQNEYREVTISPKNKHEFIQDLMSINPNIEVVYKEKKN